MQISDLNNEYLIETPFSVAAGPTDTHFLYRWELVKDIFSPIV